VRLRRNFLYSNIRVGPAETYSIASIGFSAGEPLTGDFHPVYGENRRGWGPTV